MNSCESIAPYLTSLAGLNQLKEDRHQAHLRKEKLDRFLILGRFILTEDGGLYPCIGNSLDPVPKDVLPDIPDVLTLKDAYQYMEEHGLEDRISYSYCRSIPPVDAKCPICEQGWTPANVHDVAYFGVLSQNKWVHKQCNRMHNDALQRNEFQKALNEAGIEVRGMVAVPNECCQCDLCASWYLAETPFGVLKMGWRKRVINLDWRQTGIDFLPLFTKEDVTKANGFIHCWGTAKLVEYLTSMKHFVQENPDVAGISSSKCIA